MVTDSFIDYIKTEDIYSDIVQAFEIGFDTYKLLIKHTTT